MNTEIQKNMSRKKRRWKKLDEPKYAIISIKTTRGPAKGGGTRLTMNEFSILMQHEKNDFKSWTLYNRSCFSTKIS